MILNPTGGPVRSDSHGSGEFGARRGRRFHKGVDFVGMEKQWVVAPVSGVLTRRAHPYGDGGPADDGLLIRGDTTIGVDVKMFYVRPRKFLIGERVAVGQAIGHLLSLEERYPGITTHCHMEVWRDGERVPFEVHVDS